MNNKFSALVVAVALSSLTLPVFAQTNNSWGAQGSPAVNNNNNNNNGNAGASWQNATPQAGAQVQAANAQYSNPPHYQAQGGTANNANQMTQQETRQQAWRQLMTQREEAGRGLDPAIINQLRARMKAARQANSFGNVNQGWQATQQSANPTQQNLNPANCNGNLRMFAERMEQQHAMEAQPTTFGGNQ